MLRFAIALIVVFAQCTAIATPHDIERFKQDTAKHPQWLALLHYHQVGLFSAFESQIDDDTFFLSPEGKTSPLKELDATLALFASHATEDQHRACRYPARRAWLKTRFAHLSWPDIKCPDFNTWVAELDARGLVLVYPAAYLNSPSSMFGHTFFRIKRQHGKNPLLDYAVNFAADATPSEDEFLYALKGLTGGYSGQFSVMPYYRKVNEYSFLESRDVWEYDLELQPEQLQQFVNHIWELQGVDFDYFFFTENCSYQLLTALDAVHADWALAADYRTHAIPVDTIRSLQKRGILGNAQYRPSSLNKLKAWQAQLSQSEIVSVPDLSSPGVELDTVIEPLETQEAGRSLEFAYHLMRYRSVKEKQRSPALRQHALDLLSRRSKIGAITTFQAPQTPAVRDENGHGSHRFGFFAGRFADSNYSEVQLRVAYHDLLDPPEGFAAASQLEMFDLHGRIDHSGQSARVQELGLIRIASYSPSDQFFNPVSWRFSAALTRTHSLQSNLQGRFAGGVGKSHKYGHLLGSFLWEGDFRMGSDLRRNIDGFSGPSLLVQFQSNTWSLGVGAKHYRSLTYPANDYQSMLTLEIARHLSTSWQIRAEAKHLKANQAALASELNTLSLGAYYYY